MNESCHTYEWVMSHVYRTHESMSHVTRTYKLIKRNPPPGRVFYLLCSLIKNPEEDDPPWRNTPKIDQFWGWFFRGGPLHLGSWFGNHPTKKPPRGGEVLYIKVNESCLAYTCEAVLSRKRTCIGDAAALALCKSISHVTRVSHIWMSHVTNAHICAILALCNSVSHVTRMNDSCNTCGWVMSHMWMIHVTHMNESCPAYAWVMSCTHTYEWFWSFCYL